MAISQGPRRSMVSKATCAASSCEALSPCRGLRPHHARKDRVGTWETSSGPQSLWRSRAAAGRRGAEAAVEQARSSDEPRSTGEAPEQGRDERRRRAWREGGSVGGMVDDWRCSGRRNRTRHPVPVACLRIGAAEQPPRSPDRARPPARARCGKAARRDLCGGQGEIPVPTATAAKELNWDADAVVMSGRRNGGARQRERVSGPAWSKTLACP